MVILQWTDRVAPDQGRVLGEQLARLFSTADDCVTQDLHLFKRSKYSGAVNPWIFLGGMYYIGMD